MVPNGLGLGRGLFKNPQDAERRRMEMTVPPRNRAEEDEEEELKHLKIQFPRFCEGDEAKSWIADCNEYFRIYGVYSRRRIAIAAMHVHEVAKSWYKVYVIGKPNLTWEQFSADFISKFTEAGVEDVFEQFKLLRQEGNVNDYYDKFEKHKGWLMEEIPSLTEAFFVGSFVGGLKEEIKRVVKLFDPQTVVVAYKQTKHCESTVVKPITVNPRSATFFASKKEEVKPANAPLLVYPKTKPALDAPRRLTAAQRDERRMKGLCFYCDEKYSIRHQCAKPKVFMMVSDEGEYDGPPIYDEEAGQTSEEAALIPEILAAITAPTKPESLMILEGNVRDLKVEVLVDGGSTLNLMSEEFGVQLPEVWKIDPQGKVIVMPNGEAIRVYKYCPSMQVKIQGLIFNCRIWLASLKNWELILGVDWLKQLGGIQWDYTKLEMSFQYEGQPVKLQAETLMKEDGSCNYLTIAQPVWMTQLVESYEEDEELGQIIVELAGNPMGPHLFELS